MGAAGLGTGASKAGFTTGAGSGFLMAGGAGAGLVFTTTGILAGGAFWGAAFFTTTGFLAAGFLAATGFLAGAFLGAGFLAMVFGGSELFQFPRG